jgi:hemerythrin-like domain-containing protein
MGATEILEAIRAFGEHEHQELARGLDHIHDAGRGVDPMVRATTRREVVDVLAWCDDVLEPHIAWEESWLYPQIERVTGTAWATRAARFDHSQLHALEGRLRQDELLMVDALTPDGAHEVRAHLFGFEAVLRAHIEREEHLLLPLLGTELASGPPPAAARA